MIPKKMFWPMCLLLATLFIWGLAEAHDTHLSDVGVLTMVTVNSCPGQGKYVVETKELGCSVIYKTISLSGHAQLHIAPQARDENGACVCPNLKGD